MYGEIQHASQSLRPHHDRFDHFIADHHTLDVLLLPRCSTAFLLFDQNRLYGRYPCEPGLCGGRIELPGMTKNRLEKLFREFSILLLQLTATKDL